MHHPSEHTIDGKLYPLEIHLVHIAEAQSYEHVKNKITVVGIMVELDENSKVEFMTTWVKGKHLERISNFNIQFVYF